MEEIVYYSGLSRLTYLGREFFGILGSVCSKKRTECPHTIYMGGGARQVVFPPQSDRFAQLPGADRRGDCNSIGATVLEGAPGSCAAFCLARRMTDVDLYLSVAGGFMVFDYFPPKSSIS